MQEVHRNDGARWRRLSAVCRPYSCLLWLLCSVYSCLFICVLAVRACVAEQSGKSEIDSIRIRPFRLISSRRSSQVNKRRRRKPVRRQTPQVINWRVGGWWGSGNSNNGNNGSSDSPIANVVGLCSAALLALLLVCSAVPLLCSAAALPGVVGRSTWSIMDR